MDREITLSKKKRREIEEVATAIQNRVGLTYPENSLEDILKALDVIFFEMGFPKDIEGGIKGAAKKNDSGKIVIAINDKLAEDQKSFVIAHLLGHVLLHLDDSKKIILDTNNIGLLSLSKKEEYEADYFALSLLIPSKKYLEVKDVIVSEKKLSDYFGVSIAAIRMRKAWL